VPEQLRPIAGAAFGGDHRGVYTTPSSSSGSPV
jgi:hypothetical protein